MEFRLMIVDPDFPDHWKTRMLVGLLADEVAPVYVLRLWAHCQNRRRYQFDSLSAEALKALCHFPGNANKLESSLVASGFVRRDSKGLVVSGWDEYNSALLASWENGKKGGRPPKEKPTGSETETQNKPLGFSKEKTPSLIFSTLGLFLSSELVPSELKEERFYPHWVSWEKHRKEIKHPLKPTQVAAQLKMLGKLGIERAIAMIEHTVEKGWQGLREADEPKNGKTPHKSRDADIDEILGVSKT